MNVAFVTGTSRGIGRAIVERLTAGGWTVAGCARTRDGAAQAKPDLALACDVTDREQVAAAIAAVRAELGGLDAVVNNAGLAGGNPLDAGASDELWHRILDVNLNGTYLVCKHAMPHLPDGRGRIVNIASVLGLHGVPDQSAYCAAKHGVVGVTRSLAQYLGPRRITVNAVCPGWTRSEMAEGRWEELGIDEAEAAGGIPIGRITEPAEVAGLVAFLLSEEGASITGQALTIDGGAWA